MTTLYLTIDDAPSAALPPKADRLREDGIPALFFCEGQKLDANPDGAREAIEAGYHLGNHLYSHPYSSELSVEEFRDELVRTETVIDEAYDAAGVDRPVKLFRFPYGDQGGDNKAEFQAALDEYGFRPPRAANVPAKGQTALAVDAMHGTWEEGDLDWHWTSHIEDWDLETTEEVTAALGEIADQLDGDDSELFLYHDAPTPKAQLDAFLDDLANYDVTFGDPIALADF